MGQILNADELDGVDPQLVEIVTAAAAASPFNVRINDGMRSGGKENHKRGYAIDVQLIEPSTGKELPNKLYYHGTKTVIPGARDAFPAYEQFAQTARVYQQQKYPKLDSVFRWGGGFRQGGTPFDMMHFDITPSAKGAMAYYNWYEGLTASGKAAQPKLVSNGGLGGTAGSRRVAQYQQSLSGSGGLVPPAGMATDAPQPAIMSASLRDAPSSVSAYAPSTAVPTVNDPFLAASIAALSGKQQVPATSPAPVPAPAPSGMERLNIVDLTKGGKVRGVDIPANPYTGWQRGESVAPWVREAAALQPSTAPEGSIGGIVFHHTGSRDLYASMTAGQDPKSPTRTGAQYYIDTDGTIYRYADDSDVMQNVSTRKFRTDAEGSQTRSLTNQSVIGIEVVASGSGKITEAQKKAAAALGSSLAGKYGIPPENVIGHGAIQGGVGGNKEADEGMELADLTRAAIDSAPVRTASLDQGAPDLMEALSRRVAARSDMSSIPGSPYVDKGRLGGNPISEVDPASIGIGVDGNAGGLGALTGDKPFPMVPDLLTALERRAAVMADPVGEGAKSSDLLTFLQKRAETAPFRVADVEGSAGAGIGGSASGSAVIPPRVQIANAGGTAGFGVGGATSGAAEIPQRGYDSPRSAEQVAELYEGIFPARPAVIAPNQVAPAVPVSFDRIAPIARSSTFPARPAVIAPNAPTSTPRVGTIRTADGIAGTVQLPHDVRPSVTIPKLPMTATGSIGSGINNAVGGAAVIAPMTKTIMVANPDYAEYLKSIEIPTMPSGYGGYIPGMSTSAATSSKPNMRGGNRTPVVKPAAQYASPPPKLIPKTVTVAPVIAKPAQQVATVAPAPARTTGTTVVDALRAKGLTQSQAYEAANRDSAGYSTSNTYGGTSDSGRRFNLDTSTWE